MPDSWIRETLRGTCEQYAAAHHAGLVPAALAGTCAQIGQLEDFVTRGAAVIPYDRARRRQPVDVRRPVFFLQRLVRAMQTDPHFGDIEDRFRKMMRGRPFIRPPAAIRPPALWTRIIGAPRMVGRQQQLLGGHTPYSQGRIAQKLRQLPKLYGPGKPFGDSSCSMI